MIHLWVSEIADQGQPITLATGNQPIVAALPHHFKSEWQMRQSLLPLATGKDT